MNAKQNQEASPKGPKLKVNWSTEQTEIFSWFCDGSGHLVIQAFAGTGKTTTIKEAFNHAPEVRMLYAVFNKRNQKEAESKITDTRVEVKTLHSLGFGFIKQNWSNAKPDENIEMERATAVQNFAQEPAALGLVLKLVSFAKNTTLNTTPSDLQKICVEQDICFDGTIDGCAVAMAVLELSKVRASDRISFDDMVWLPCVMNWVRPRYDLVCIDEAQDMNLPQLTMARQACSGRVIVVGDSRQAIYGFRGAVQGGMQMMKMTLRAKELSLTTTYRCPRAVVDHAQTIVPGYKAAPECAEGEVVTINEVKMLSDAKPGDAILSRLNAPLMPLALSFLRKNIPARIEGRDIGKQLCGMVRLMKAKSVPDFITKINSWREKQIERLSKSKNSEKKIEQASDVAETLLALAQDASSVNDIETKLVSLFQDTDENSRPAIVLSSVHKAKGLEWPRVFILAHTFRQAKGGEEANIYYVAVTRAQQSLYIVQQSGQPVVSPSLPAPVTKVAQMAPQEPNSLPGSVIPGLVTPINIERKVESFGGTTQRRYERGDVIPHSGTEFVCESVSESGSRFVCLSRSVKIIKPTFGEAREIKQAAQVISLSAYYDPGFLLRKMDEDEINNFFTHGSRRAKEKNITMGEGEENGMAKTKVKKAKSEKRPGKIAWIAELCLAGGKTKSQIVAAAMKHFDGLNEKTAKNTVQWVASYYIPTKLGKKSRHVEEERAVKAKAPAKTKAAKKVKVPAPKKKAPAKKVTAEAKATPPPPRATPPPAATPEPAAELTTEATTT